VAASNRSTALCRKHCFRNAVTGQLSHYWRSPGARLYRGFAPQELSNLLWATAKMGYRHKALLTAAADQAARQLEAEMGVETDGAAAVDGTHVGGSTEEDVIVRRNVLCTTGTKGYGHIRPPAGDPNSWKPAPRLPALREGYDVEDDITDSSIAAQIYRNSAMTAAAAATTTGRVVRHGRSGSGSHPPGQHKYHHHKQQQQPHQQQPICWSNQAVSNTTWAYATLGFQPGEKYLRQVCRHLSSPQHLPGYKWQEIANTVWALASLQHRDCTAALAAVEREVVARLGGASLNLAAADDDNGMAGEQHQRHQRQAPLHNRLIMECLPELRPQHVSNLLWSYATLQHPAPALFTTLLPLLERRLPLFSEQEISNSVWATARLQVYDEKVMDAVAEHICLHRRLPYLKPQEVANIAWAYSGLRHEHRALFDGLVGCMVDFIHMPGAAAAAAASNTASADTAADAETNLNINTDIDTSTQTKTKTKTKTARSSTVKMPELASICGSVATFGWHYPALLSATKQWLIRLVTFYRRSTLFYKQRRHQETQRLKEQDDQHVSSSSSGPLLLPTGVIINHAQRQEGAAAAGALEATSAAGHHAEAAVVGLDIGSAQQQQQLPATADERYSSRPYWQQQEQQQQQLVKARDVCYLMWGLSLVGACSPEMWGQLMELMGRVLEDRGGSDIDELLDEELSQVYQVGVVSVRTVVALFIGGETCSRTASLGFISGSRPSISSRCCIMVMRKRYINEKAYRK
ncbi:hypothetical protein Vretimale_12866, partial [Volvox reticuliferus]